MSLKNNKYIGIDLFSGAGGMSLGATMAGVSISHAVEMDKFAAQTYKKNHNKSTNLFSDDIRKFTDVNIKLKNDQQLIVFGGPPCQGFSTSNQRTRNKENTNNWLFQEFIRVVKETRPSWVVFENVRGIVETEKGLFVEKICNEFKKAGYECNYSVLNATDFGVPQKRSRFFLVASLDGVRFSFPEAKKKQYVTVNDAISDLPALDNGANFYSLPYKPVELSPYAKKMRGKLAETYNHSVTKNAEHIIDRYKHVPQGGNWENIPEELMQNYTDRSRCHTKIYHRLKADQPSTVIGNYRKNMLIHPTEHRGLSVREAARLQSFPDWFEFQGSVGFQQQQVGNAVPPLLAQAVFQEVLKHG